MNDAERLNIPELGPRYDGSLWDDAQDDLHYDRAGNPISLRDYMRLRYWDRLTNGGSYTIVRQEEVGDYFVSTVWVGMDYSFGHGRPLIFETMVFKGGETDLDCERWSSEEEALEGHKKMVEKVSLFSDL